MIEGISLLVVNIFIVIFFIYLFQVVPAYTALWLGDPTPKMDGMTKLNPENHLTVFGSFIVPILGSLFLNIIFGWGKGVRHNSYNLTRGREFLFLISGFVMIAIIIFLVAVALRVFDISPFSTLFQLLTNLSLIGMFFFIVNLLPIPGLLGSSIFSLIFTGNPDGLWKKFPVSYNSATYFLFIFVLIFIFFSVVGNIPYYILTNIIIP